MSDSLQEIISRLWTTPENAEWTPKTDVIPLSDVQRWMASSDIEILGFTHHLLSNQREGGMNCFLDGLKRLQMVWFFEKQGEYRLFGKTEDFGVIRV